MVEFKLVGLLLCLCSWKTQSFTSTAATKIRRSSFLVPGRQQCRHHSSRRTTTTKLSSVSPDAVVSGSKKQQDFSRGAALLLEDVAITRGPNQILRQIDWRVEPRTKWALIGANGSGMC